MPRHGGFHSLYEFMSHYEAIYYPGHCQPNGPLRCRRSAGAAVPPLLLPVPDDVLAAGWIRSRRRTQVRMVHGDAECGAVQQLPLALVTPSFSLRDGPGNR